ncbi:hypothetical protein WA1_19430 [Scytonema hofmannii PCC 7110]|jgi:hypothetical protein|uniref:DUF4278 domain-containing protein n=1 Tax=Scytonema hofmannii PCC 7110 TaxID=128403 RepID=A0A139XBY3_9CYAN|nr:DUF4278 domain-containing protein [Scytonema hofmannii]KYC42163.1 hypothetical protein WA1_19430 [Scytonema hofmannii PCC 7110]
MKLTYRGTHYEHSPLNPEVIAGETGGKYRGKTWTQNYLRHIPQTQPVAELKYRGVAYSIGDPLDVELMMLSKQRSKDASVVESGSVKKCANEIAKAHLTNIRRNLEHRLQVAKENGDQNLIRLLEDEAKQIA